MIPFALANVMTHAGANPLCFCCCDKDNQGGHHFDDSVTQSTRRLNPLVKVIPGVVDNAVDSDASVESGVNPLQQESHRRHQREQGQDSKNLATKAGNKVSVHNPTLSNDETLELLKVIELIEDDEHNNKIRIKLTTNLHE